jgi:hypothetical protein
MHGDTHIKIIIMALTALLIFRRILLERYVKRGNYSIHPGFYLFLYDHHLPILLCAWWLMKVKQDRRTKEQTSLSFIVRARITFMKLCLGVGTTLALVSLGSFIRGPHQMRMPKVQPRLHLLLTCTVFYTLWLGTSNTITTAIVMISSQISAAGTDNVVKPQVAGAICMDEPSTKAQTDTWVHNYWRRCGWGRDILWLTGTLFVIMGIRRSGF